MWIRTLSRASYGSFPSKLLRRLCHRRLRRQTTPFSVSSDNVVSSRNVAVGANSRLPLSAEFVEIDPIVLKVDYKPKHVDFANLKGGNLVEIMNFFPLDGAEMTLRKVRLAGVSGFCLKSIKQIQHVNQSSTDLSDQGLGTIV